MSAFIMTDKDPMPFGKYKGVPISKVPDDYMFWLWTKGNLEKDTTSPVACYIRENISAYEKDYPDGIWR